MRRVICLDFVLDVFSPDACSDFLVEPSGGSKPLADLVSTWGYEFRRSGPQGQNDSLAGGTAAPDPLASIRAGVRACTTEEALQALLHPPRHFEGFRGEEDTSTC